MTEDRDTLAFRNLVRALKRRAGVIAVCTIVVAGSALAFSLLQTKQYSATAVLLFRSPAFSQELVGPSSALPASTPSSDRDAATNVALVSLNTVAAHTAQALGGGVTPAEVADEVSIGSNGQTDTAAVTATDPDPQFAAKLANAYADSFVAFRRAADRKKIADAERLIKRQLGNMSATQLQTQQANVLQAQAGKLQTLRDIQTGNAEVVQRADAPSSPSSPNILRNTGFGLAVGLLLGIAAALALERLDRRIKDPSELEETFQFPVLGTVPQSKALESLRDHNGNLVTALPFQDSEAFRMLRTRLRYFNVDRELRSLVVTSALPTEGKSTIACNLALTSAEAGSQVILLEADFHKQTLARGLDLAPMPGLAEVLTGQSSVDSAIQKLQVAEGSNGKEAPRHLDVMTAGATPPNPVELLESHEMGRLLDELMGRGYELVVLDTPPMNMLADAIPLIKTTSGVIIVSQLGKLTRDEAGHLREQLERLDAPVLGVIGNRVRARDRKYGYGYYYGYGSPNEVSASASPTRWRKDKAGATVD